MRIHINGHMENSELIRGVEGAVRAWGRRPTWDEYFICAAILMASHKNRIVAAGYNGFLPGAPHSSCVRDGHEQATVHAEQNAVSDAARRGVPLSGCTAYITHFPCVNCAKLLVAAGISKIKYLHDYNNDDLCLKFFEDSRVEIEKL